MIKENRFSNKRHWQRHKFSSDKTVLISWSVFSKSWKEFVRIWLEEMNVARISTTGLLSEVRKRGNCYLWRNVKSVCGMSKLFWEWGQQNPGLENGQDIICMPHQNCSVFKAVMGAKGSSRYIGALGNMPVWEINMGDVAILKRN